VYVPPTHVESPPIVGATQRALFAAKELCKGCGDARIAALRALWLPECGRTRWWHVKCSAGLAPTLPCALTAGIQARGSPND